MLINVSIVPYCQEFKNLKIDWLKCLILKRANSLYILLAKIESFTHHCTLTVYSITSEEFSCCYLVTKLYLTLW